MREHVRGFRGERGRERQRQRERERMRDQGMTLFWFTAYYHHNPLSCFPLCSPGTPLASSLR